MGFHGGFKTFVRGSVAAAGFWPFGSSARGALFHPAGSQVCFAGPRFVLRGLIGPAELWFLPRGTDPSGGALIRPEGP